MAPDGYRSLSSASRANLRINGHILVDLEELRHERLADPEGLAYLAEGLTWAGCIDMEK